MTRDIDPSSFAKLALEHHDDGVWIVTLNRPSKRNALDIATIEELVRFFSAAPLSGVRAVVLAGAGDHFCAGLDLKSLDPERPLPKDPPSGFVINANSSPFRATVGPGNPDPEDERL